MNIENFRFFRPFEIRWNDLDPIGHVNNVYYFDYFQTGRSYYMLEASQRWDWNKNMFVIAHVSCNYLTELKITAQNTRVGMRVTKIGSKSFDFEYIILSDDKDGKPLLHAQGISTQVFVDLSIGKSIEIPDWLIEDFYSYEPSLEK